MKKIVFTLTLFLFSFLSLSSAAGAAAAKTQALLAISWQPAFCQANQRKPECASQTPARYDADHFTLHGLWPQKQSYCGIGEEDRQADKKGDWEQLPAPELQPQTKLALDKVMPGTQSKLERHEWVKHGTCAAGLSADAYFSAAIRLTEELNQSAVQRLFAASIGKRLDATAIKAAFDESFGRGAGDRVRMSCKGKGEKRMIVELTIGLSGEAVSGRSLPLKDLMAGAGETVFGCDSGLVDAAGF